jgi:hypothetical protein
MAGKFKVGDKVRVIGSHELPHVTRQVGKVGVVWLLSDSRFPVDVHLQDGAICPFAESELAPLLPPDSQWAEDAVRSMVKRVMSEPLPLTKEQVEEVGRG